MHILVKLLNALGYKYTLVIHDHQHFQEKKRYSNVHIVKQPINRKHNA